MKENGTRSFNSAGSQVRFDRSRRRKKRTAIIWAIAAVSLAITIFAFLIFAELFGWFEKSPDGPDGDPQGNTTLEFEEKLVSSDEKHKGELILINSSFPYVFPEETPTFSPCYNGRTPHGKFASGNTIYAYYTQNGIAHCAKFDAKMLAAFNALADDFYEATKNCDLFIYDEDGYRSYEYQDEKHQSNPSEYVPAGQTEHHLGTSIDLYGNISSDSPVYNIDDPQYASIYKWIYDNAYKYGFVLRYAADKANITGVTNEPYHFRYVGYEHAYYMSQNGLCLEEYLDLIRDSHAYSGTHLEFDGDDGNHYTVYYVAASADAVTSISVPKTSDKVSYTISGDNKEGFIITVKEIVQS